MVNPCRDSPVGDCGRRLSDLVSEDPIHVIRIASGLSLLKECLPQRPNDARTEWKETIRMSEICSD